MEDIRGWQSKSRRWELCGNVWIVDFCPELTRYLHGVGSAAQTTDCLIYSPPFLPRSNLSTPRLPRNFCENSPQKLISLEESGIMYFFMHSNTITVFLIEITTIECFRSRNIPLNYSLKYGKTAKFRNFQSKVLKTTFN
jgi:hypothetical protein